jgi:PAS domain S-box-containing protein
LRSQFNKRGALCSKSLHQSGLKGPVLSPSWVLPISNGGTSRGREMRSRPHRFGYILLLVIIPFVTLVAMSAFQLLKHILWPNITVWGSHIHTAVFLTAVAAVGGFVACRYLEVRSLLAYIVESSDDAIIGVTLDGIVSSWNRGAENIYGYPAREVVGKPASILLPSDRPGDISNILDSIRRGERVERYETTRMRKDGKKVHIALIVSPILDAAGEIIGASSIARDITERKEGEGELKQTNTYLENVFENSPDAIGIVDIHGKFIKWNKMAAELYGYSFEELRGKSSFDLYADSDQMELMLNDLRRQGSVKKREILMKKKDGSTAPAEISIGLLRDREGKVLGSMTVGRDLSEIKKALIELGASNERLSGEIIERKRAEEQVQRLSRQNQLILDAAGEGILGLDLAGRVTFINPAGAELAGYRIGELIQKDFHQLVHHSRADGAPYPEHECSMFETLSTGVVRHERDEVFWRKDGTSFPVAYSSTPILEEDQIVGAVLTFRDITLRKLAVEQLNKYRDHLEDLVKERTTELAMANERLSSEIDERKRAEKALKLFAYSVAHDLKSPAIGIYGLTRRLHKQFKDVLDEKGRNYCEQILKVSEHIAALADKINVYIVTKEASPVFERIKIKEILKMLKDEFSSQLIIRGIEWLEPATDIEIMADRLSILRLFRNFVDNALKYGGERLSKIWIGYEETESSHIFSITDNGKGLKAMDAEKIFGLFQRNETSRGIEGAGLGLAIVKEIAQLHGGRVWVEPAAKKGTTFFTSISKSL